MCGCRDEPIGNLFTVWVAASIGATGAWHRLTKGTGESCQGRPDGSKKQIGTNAGPVFHEDSYGYRPDKPALDAIAMARGRCFRMKWVIEFDIVGLFDNINHGKLLELIRKHCQEKWVLLYIGRCPEAPISMPDKRLKERNAGTPQGGVINQVLANLFMHYEFDRWMAGRFPECPWERYADDGIIHCIT